MGRLLDWWRRLTGVKAGSPGAARNLDARPGPATDDPGLQVLDTPADRRPHRSAEAGFDPYSSDAGFAKPHSWERVDHD